MRTIACLTAIAVIATPAIARQHHQQRAAHKAKPKPKAPAAPDGATAVPASGLKVYCAGRKSPLLVRKFTQGSGTTVTVLCR